MPSKPNPLRQFLVRGALLSFLASVSFGGSAPRFAGRILAEKSQSGIRDQREVVWIGDIIYAGGAETGRGGGLTIWDVSNPQSPVFLAEESTGLNFARGVAVRDGIAYVTGRDSASFTAIDVSTPAKPRALGVLKDERLLGARGIAFAGDFAIVACGLHPSTEVGTQGIAVVDVKEPTRLQLVARLDEKIDPRIVSGGSVVVDGQRRSAFVSMYRHDGVMVFDISSPRAPSLRTVFRTHDLASARGLSLRGDVLFVSGAESASVVALDVSNPDRLAQLGAISHSELAGARGNALVADGRGLVVSGRASGKSVLLDVTQPNRMTLHGTIGSHRGLYGVCSRGNEFAHVSASTGALIIGRIDVLD